MFGVCLAVERNADRMRYWDYTLSHFKPDAVYVLGEGDLPNGKPFRNAIRISDTDEIAGPVTLLAPKKGRHMSGTTMLEVYDHPDPVTYIFGPDNGHIERYYRHTVYIPTDTHDEMYSFVACAITLYDRRLKQRG